MVESEAIREVRFNMSTIGLSDKAAKRVVEARDMAIMALEKQISKKVVKDGKLSYKCPCCGECAETDCGDAFYDYRLDYCNGCGQKLDWSDEE